ncbi:MAG: 50S ribosomal protein L23 [Candidatus Kaiserbacteria bacterium]|nr:50S ribosomal protein L23 [Candidatus Kaiserbacteria bacterium]
MIFGRLFKKKRDVTADQAGAPNEEAPGVALPQEYAGKTTSSQQVTKKTKTDKRNVALRQEKKRRSRKVVHTKRSFHRGNRQSAEEGVYIYDVIERPVITEKSANHSENGVYTFFVRDTANKHTVADAVEALYGVRPKKVRILKQPSKKKRVRIPGKEREYGMTARRKKAYVSLREGDTIKLT